MNSAANGGDGGEGSRKGVLIVAPVLVGALQPSCAHYNALQAQNRAVVVADTESGLQKIAEAPQAFGTVVIHTGRSNPDRFQQALQAVERFRGEYGKSLVIVGLTTNHRTEMESAGCDLVTTKAPLIDALQVAAGNGGDVVGALRR